MLEIERKFRLRHLPQHLLTTAPHEIEQGYIAIDPDSTHVRLRRSDQVHTLTVKRGHGPVREEREVRLEPAQFHALWPLTAGRRLSKLRYVVPQGRWRFEIDVFQGRHEGLIVAELEFPDVEACRAFTPPMWCGEEVTGNPEYSNVRLASDSTPSRLTVAPSVWAALPV
jgi:CYTH domain-containing protein